MDDMWWGQKRPDENWAVRWLFRIVGSLMGVMLVLLLIHNLGVSDDSNQKNELRKMYSSSLDNDIQLYYGFIQKIENRNYHGLKANDYDLYHVNQRSHNYCSYPEGDISRMYFGGKNLKYERMMIDNAMEMICSEAQRQKLQEFLASIAGKEDQIKKEFDEQYSNN